MKNVFYLILFTIAIILVACNSKKHNEAVDEVIEKDSVEVVMDSVVVGDTITIDSVVCE